MKKRETLDIELRGQPVTVEFFVIAPDPSVGMMGFDFEDETIADADGNPLPWELTEDERMKIGEQAHEMCVRGGDDDYDTSHIGGSDK